MTADLVAILNARLDADTCNATHIHAVRCASHGYNPGEDGPHYAPWRCDCGVPARVLADVQAKRAIIQAWRDACDNPYREMRQAGHMEGLEEALTLLVNAFADDEAWRVSADDVGEHQT